ncbi:MAG: nitroreductase family protein [Atopobiaceae bacterium]|jgi:nitroreductase
MNAIFTRTSVRSYADTPIEQDKVELICRAGMQAPSAGNQQPWELLVIDDPELLKALGTATPYSKPTGKAPLAIIPLMHAEGLRFPEQAPHDMSACVENMLLQATEMGIGSVWQAVFPEEDRIAGVKACVSIPDDLIPFCIVAFGYPIGQLPAQTSRYDAARVYRNSLDARRAAEH